jgi:hypothetical protein
MTDNQRLFDQLYSAFNERNIEAALSLMTDDVSWPKASEGGRVIGKDEIRSYWKRQWQEFDPHVEPTGIQEVGDRVEVRVHQLVKNRQGEILSDSQVKHLYTMADGLIQRMDLGETETASAAFHQR